MVPGSTWSEAWERAEDARGQASASKDLKAARAAVSILKRSEQDRRRCSDELLIFNGKTTTCRGAIRNSCDITRAEYDECGTVLARQYCTAFE